MKGDLFFSLLSLAFIDCILQLVIVYKTQAVQFAFDVVKRKYTIFPEVLGKYLNFNLNSVVLMHLLLNREHVQVAMCSCGYKSKHCCWELCLVWTFENVDTLALADCWSPSSWVACCLFCVPWLPVSQRPYRPGKVAVAWARMVEKWCEFLGVIRG